MISGFEYGDPATLDWSSDINWSFLRQDGGKDVYRVESTFCPKNGTTRTQVTEVPFDGSQSVKVPGNDWQIISIESGHPFGIAQRAYLLTTRWSDNIKANQFRS